MGCVLVLGRLLGVDIRMDSSQCYLSIGVIGGLVMSIYDFGDKYAQTYTEKCSNCGKEHKVSTQRDDCPEYYTSIYVLCNCDKSVRFELPVN